MSVTGGDATIVIPFQGELTKSLLADYFDTATALTYKKDDKMYGVLCIDGVFQEPDDGWNSHEYVVRQRNQQGSKSRDTSASADSSGQTDSASGVKTPARKGKNSFVSSFVSCMFTRKIIQIRNIKHRKQFLYFVEKIDRLIAKITGSGDAPKTAVRAHCNSFSVSATTAVQLAALAGEVAAVAANLAPTAA